MPFVGHSLTHEPASTPFPLLFLALTSLLVSGCASPGAPKAPSLHEPQVVRDLTLTRVGDHAEVHFTIPGQTTDGLPLRGAVLHVTLCRQDTPTAPCRPTAAPAADAVLYASHPGSAPRVASWDEPLPADLLTGPPRPVAYRLQLSNDAGRSAGYTSPAYVAAGTAPLQVQSFAAQGTRLGLLFHWTPAPNGGEVLLERTELDLPAPSEGRSTRHTPAKGTRASMLAVPGRNATPEPTAGTVWLQAAPGNQAAAQTIDGSVAEGVRYRYVAVRRITAQVGGRTLELRSAPSAPVEIAWQDVYPPAVPAGLTAVGFVSPSQEEQGSGTYAVDLIWQPVEDERVTGYLVDRVALAPDGSPQGSPQPLTPTPLTTPAFHDTTAQAGQSYRYEVSSIDGKGNRSAPGSAVVRSSTR